MKPIPDGTPVLDCALSHAQPGFILSSEWHQEYKCYRYNVVDELGDLKGLRSVSADAIKVEADR